MAPSRVFLGLIDVASGALVEPAAVAWPADRANRRDGAERHTDIDQPERGRRRRGQHPRRRLPFGDGRSTRRQQCDEDHTVERNLTVPHRDTPSDRGHRGDGPLHLDTQRLRKRTVLDDGEACRDGGKERRGARRKVPDHAEHDRNQQQRAEDADHQERAACNVLRCNVRDVQRATCCATCDGFGAFIVRRPPDG